MNRTAGTVALLIAVCVALPAIAAAAQVAVPGLLLLLLFLAVARLVLAPPRRH